MNRLTSAAALAATLVAGGFSVSGCATEDYVDQHIAAVNQHIDQVQNDLRGQIAAVGSRADAAAQAAANAQQTANSANALAASKANARFVFSDTGGGGSVFFDTGKWTLTEETQMTLTALAEKLKGENKDVYIEIVGHGDPRGATMANRELGAKRALQVQRFLADQGVALNRMNVVSWGEERSANPKDRSAASLKQQRRVDLIVKG